MFTSYRSRNSREGEDEHSSFNQILCIKAVHFLAFFIFFILVYVDVEVTIGGMVIHRSLSQRLICRMKVGLSHLCSTCVAGVTSRQVFSGVCLLYWAANSIQTCTSLMVGRILLLWINRKVSCCGYQVLLIPLSLIS